MRLVFRVVLMIVILALAGHLLGLWSVRDLAIGRLRTVTPAAGPADSGVMRTRLNQLDERSGRAVEKAGDYVADGSLSGRIKAKMALDDIVRARTIEVSTTDGVVTLEGTVKSVTERDQALRLARNTTGVTRVVDRLVVLP